MAQRIKVELQFKWTSPPGFDRPSQADFDQLKTLMAGLDYSAVKQNLASLGLDIADQVTTVVVMQEDFR